MGKWILGTLICFTLGVACMPDDDGSQAATDLSFSQASIAQQEGPCGMEDNAPCLTLKVSYPLANGGGSVGDSINQLLQAYLADVLGALMPEHPTGGRLASLTTQLVEEYKAYRTNSPEVDLSWHIEIRGEVLYRGLDFLTLAFHHREQAGPRIAKGWSQYLVFDLMTGQSLSPNNLLAINTARKRIIERYFRAETGMLPNQRYTEMGFSNLDRGFRLPANLGRTDDAYLFHYNPHELGPTVDEAVGFTISATELFPEEVPLR